MLGVLDLAAGVVGGVCLDLLGLLGDVSPKV